jgi:hypothetical protein
MTQPDFAALLEQELRLLAVPFDQAELLTYAADVWPVAQDDPDVRRWSKEFLRSTAAPDRKAEAAIVAGVADALGRV